ncbi:WXG100 family type VII secretion target [Micromonospora sp. NPDC049171]|uniref:WXG100-like domain-containing protein n=1 Tax=Micromonospora sp. NPDC049171 TaxID=3155770 RepID=UPI0033D01E7A
MTSNPLVAAAADTPPSAWAGVWICEDIELIAQGVRNGSWVDGSLGVVSASLDALAFVSDPVGALLQYGIAWLIEHVKPLSEALDWLAGDPAQITAHAQTWRNVAASLRDEAAELARAVRTDVAGWGGSAGPAYRGWAAEQQQAITGLAQGADTMAAITEGAAGLVAAVRLLVRDAIATCVSRLIVYAGELVITGGLAAPLVVEQVTTLVASWGARIARLLRGLLASLRRLIPEMRRLGDLIEKLKQALGRLQQGESPPSRHAPEPEPPRETPGHTVTEQQRVHDLGMDPATGRFRPGEAETAARLEQEVGVRLQRAPADSSADWVDDAGRTYDAVGNFPAQFFDRQWPQLQYQIERHLDKADLVPVDVVQFNPEQVARIEQFITDRNLGPRVFIVGK